MALNYDPEEIRGLTAELRRMRDEGSLDVDAGAFRGHERPGCPRCGAPMTLRRVPPRAEVAYVRDRLWLSCAGCGRSAVVDRRALDR